MTSKSLRRLPDWQSRLAAFVSVQRDARFDWVSNNCCTSAADAILAVTGQDVAPPELRAACTSSREALRYLAAHGGVLGLAREVLGEPVSPRQARPGDIVAIEVGKRVALAVCNGTTALGPTRRGMAAVPMSRARCAWRVG